MFKSLTLTAAALAATLTLGGQAEASSCRPDNHALRSGTFVNVDPATRSVTRMITTAHCRYEQRAIPGGDGRTMPHVVAHWDIHLYGSCSPRDCDWGVTRGQANDRVNRVTASYDQGFARREVTLRPDGQDLIVEIRTTYTDARPPAVWTERMRRVR